MSADDTICRIIDLPKFSDERGSLTFLESFQHVPFDIKGCFTCTTYLAALLEQGMPLKPVTSS